MDASRIRALRNTVRRYAWGSRTAIPELLGEAPSGQPQAELWMGAHPSAPSRVVTDAGEEPLDAWIRRDPDAVLGPRCAARFGGELPFLLKVLAAERPLSLQAHPSGVQARAGFARENAAGIALDACERCYRDAHHKPELICALTTFRALNRFRAPGEIEAGLAALGVPALEPLLEPLRDAAGREALARFFGRLMTLAPAARERLVGEAVEAAARLGPGDPARAEVLRLARAYPGDAGVLAPLFLQRVELAPGEAMFLPAGELHGYLGGVGIELMASSDNVLRGGLTDKHVDVPELLATLGFEHGAVERLRPRACGPAEDRYATPAEEFALSVIRLDGRLSWQAPAERGVEILLCTQGRAQLADARGRRLELVRGASALAPAAAGAYRAEGSATLYRATVGALD